MEVGIVQSQFKSHGSIQYRRKTSQSFNGIAWKLESRKNHIESLLEQEEPCNTYNSWKQIGNA